ncbi:S8 family serine peptidase [Actinoplanes xinjiangensis]|uniref:Type VII secretion-associated serine protease mycosin n=1 Tax=Actinoplanes xinjiangensis TaxID=512350 RepID=A0A316FAV9_9ACTN|nr:type VII secretion-associated serine protease mycosin [Actinoplanes xinjiangensis]GIF43115.1 type VII secretion-associated serine protease [Actinoplanes xinjiangensis]
MRARANLAYSCVSIIIAIAPSSPAQADQVRSAQWFAGYLKLNQAHQITKGHGVTVAVVDSGVTPHIDIARNLRRGTDTVSGGDGFGQKDDSEGHGTKMAGLIAGHGHDGNGGVLGIAPEASLIPVKGAGRIDESDGITPGIKWAAEASADIINVSVTASRGRPLTEAISAAASADSLVVAAVGNTSENSRLAYPAAISEVLAVGATGRDGQRADFSITGSAVDICAPGVDIVTTFQANKYYKGNGTSEATAVVSGAAALVRAKFPTLSAQEVAHRLTSTADDNGPRGRDEQCGFGVLNIVKALTADVPPLNPAGASGSAGPTAAASAGVSASPGAGAGASTDVASPEPAGSSFPLVAGIAAGVVAVGALLAFMIRRRRRGAS